MDCTTVDLSTVHRYGASAVVSHLEHVWRGFFLLRLRLLGGDLGAFGQNPAGSGSRTVARRSWSWRRKKMSFFGFSAVSDREKEEREKRLR